MATMRRAAALLAAVGVAAGLAAPATARRVPSASETRGIRDAARQALCGACVGFRLHFYPATVSTVDTHFAAVSVDGRDPHGQPLQVVTVLSWRGTRRWAAIDFGSASVGCDYITARVRRDLRLGPC